MTEVKEVVLTKEQREVLNDCILSLSERDYTWYIELRDYFAFERHFIACAVG